MSLATQLLYTTIANVSGSALSVNFIGITGRRLAAGEEVSQFGTLFDWVRNGAFGFGSWVTPRQKQLEALIDAGSIAVLQTPTVVLRDKTVAAKSRLLQGNSAAVETAEVQAGVFGTVLVVGP